jgi:hypothetical protein
LYGSATVQKDEAYVIARDLSDETLRVLDHVPNLPVKFRYIHRVLRGQYSELLRREATVPCDLGKHFFGRQSGTS